MKSSKKFLLIILAILIVIFCILLVFEVFKIISFDFGSVKTKQENYLEEKNNTIIASGMDGYIFKINDNVLFYTLDENIVIMKTDLTYNDDYSDLTAKSKTIFSFKNPEESYYMVKGKRFYIKNKSLDKYIDLQTFEVKDFTDSVKGNWIVFQET